MMRFLMASLASVVVLAGGAQAAEFSAKEKAEIEALVRSYILENPEIIPEAIDILRAKQTRQAIAAAGPALYSEAGAVLVGPKNASVTIVEFYDYQCGFCRRGLDVLERLLANDKDVNILFRQLPIRDKGDATHSYDSAVAAIAASRQNRNFLKFHRGLYESPTRLSKDRILQIAQQHDLNISQLKRDMADASIAESIEQNQMLAAMLGIRGTPGYIIGDVIIRGAESYDILRDAVEEARANKRKG